MLIIVSGPCRLNKSIIVNELIKLDERPVIISSYTTKVETENDRNSNMYKFISIDEFIAMRNSFFDISMVKNDLYGTTKEDINNVLKKNRIPLIYADKRGFTKYRRSYDVLSIFITTSKKTLEKRDKLTPRNTFFVNKWFDLYFNLDNESVESIVDEIIAMINVRTYRVNLTSNFTARVDYYLYRWKGETLIVLYEHMNDSHRTEIVNELYRLFRLSNLDNFRCTDTEIIFQHHLVQYMNELVYLIPKVY